MLLKPKNNCYINTSSNNSLLYSLPNKILSFIVVELIKGSYST